MPKVPKPPIPPSRNTADDAGEDLRKRLAGRKGYADAIRTSARGATDFGKNTQVTSLSSGTATTMGVGA
jgi:hypothetical protein